jgi:hypothetical protein
MEMLRFIVTFSAVTVRIYTFHIKNKLIPPEFIKATLLTYDLIAQAALCQLLVINYKTTAFPVKKLDAVAETVIEYINRAVRRIETKAANHLG